MAKERNNRKDRKKERAKERRDHKETKYRKRRTSILYAVMAVLVSFVAVILACTVFFRVEDVAVEGNERYSTEEILAAASVEKGSNLPLTAGELLQGRICSELPYIESVKLEKHLPTTLVLVVKEAPPIAVVEQDTTIVAEDPEPVEDDQAEQTEDPEDTSGEDGDTGDAAQDTGDTTEPEPEPEPAAPVQGGWWLLDAKARLLEPVDESAVSSYIRVTGITAVTPEKSKVMSVLQGYEGQLEALIELLQAIQDQGIQEKITEIDVSSPTEVVVLYDGRLRGTMLISADFSRKMVIFKQICDLLGDSRQGTVNLKTKDAYYTPGGV